MSVVVVDVGGSSRRIATGRDAADLTPETVDFRGVGGLVTAVRGVVSRPSAVGVSVAGFVHQNRGYVRLSRAAPDLEGPLGAQLSEALGCPVVVVNDGTAHAAALEMTNRFTHGALAVALGTSVGIGMTDSGGRLLVPCSGENWDLGEWRLDTSAAHREVWWALGSRGLDALIAERGESDGWRQYGHRLGSFLVRASQVFQPRTIVLSGGIAHAGGRDLVDVVRGELLSIPDYLETPSVMLSPFREAGVVGAWVLAWMLAHG